MFLNRFAIHRLLGILVWAALAAALAFSLTRSSNVRGASMLATLGRYALGPVAKPVRIDPTNVLQRGDPVFWENASGTWEQIGYVDSASPAKPDGSLPGSQVRFAWFTSEPDPSECELFLHSNSGRLEDMVQILLPEEKRARIQQRIVAAMQTHGDELSQSIGPLVEESLRESLPLIEAEVRASLLRRRDELHRVGDRLQREVVKGRLVPMAKERLLPIVKRHAQEPAEEIGRELWERASMWRFGWRIVYDSAPLPKRDLTKEEWRRFLEEEATVVIEQHMDDLTLAVQRILADAATDPTVREELGAAAAAIASDPETRDLIQGVLKDSVMENQALRAKWREIWTSERAQQSLALASERLEPVIRSIGDDLFGSRDEGIDPAFARVLRNQILGKDRRWLIAQRVDRMPSESIRVASEPMVYPVVYLADPETPTP